MPKVNYGQRGTALTPAQAGAAGLPITNQEYPYAVALGYLTPITPPPPPTSLSTAWGDTVYEVPAYGYGNGDWLNLGTSIGDNTTVTVLTQNQTVRLAPEVYQDITVGPEGYAGTEWNGYRWFTGQNGRAFNYGALLLSWDNANSADTIFAVGQSFTYVPGPMSEGAPGMQLRMSLNTTATGVIGAFFPRILLDSGSRLLSWGAPSSPGGTITGYQIIYSSDNGVTWTTAGQSNTTSFDLAGSNLTPLTDYIIGVSTITDTGGAGLPAYINRKTPPARPQAPTGVTGSEGDTQVGLTWSQPSDTGSFAISDYLIQYSSDNGATWTLFSDAVSNALSATVTGLTNGTAYKFRVAAVTVAGAGPYSSASSAYTPTGTPTAPGAPTNVSGTAGDQQVSLSWTAPGTNGGSAITDYVVQYSSDSGSSWTTFSDGTSTSTSAVVTGLTNGTAYIFRVAAVNAIGTGDYSSNSSSVTPAAVPGAPTSVSGTSGAAQVSLTWTAPASDGGSAITDYAIQYSSNSGSSWSTFADGTSTSTSAVVTGLTNGTEYIFRVAAVNAVGTGAYSSASSGVTPLDVPGAPTAVSGTAGNAEVSLTWTAPSSNGGTALTDYVVQYSSNSGSSWTTFSDGTSTTASTTVTGLTNGTAYIFRVAAVNSVGTGPYSSNSGSVTPQAPSSGLTITQQPKNDISMTSGQSVTFSLTATDSGQTLSYQWQYFGLDTEDYTTKWLNFGSNSNSVTFTGTSNGFSLDMYQTDVRLRCIVSTTGSTGPVTSDEVHWGMLWGVATGIDFYWEGTYQFSSENGTETVGGVTYERIYPTYNVEMGYDEGVQCTITDYSYAGLDPSWFSSNLFTRTLQSSPDATTWTNVGSGVNGRSSFPTAGVSFNRPGGVMPQYYRFKLETNWPVTTTNGTSNFTRTVDPIYMGHLKVYWGA